MWYDLFLEQSFISNHKNNILGFTILHYDAVLTKEQFKVHKEKENLEVITMESNGDETILEVNENYLIKTRRRNPVRELKFLALKNSIDISQATS